VGEYGVEIAELLVDVDLDENEAGRDNGERYA